MRNAYVRWCLFIVCWGAISVSLISAAEHTTDSLPAVKENIAQKKAVLVDVREEEEWDSGHVAGAVLLPLSELRAGIKPEALQKRLPPGRILYTHCVVGQRSRTAADLLRKHGYEVRALKPGYSDLLRAGFDKAKE
jgi:rhodanese-related sulfurtransferase